MAKPAPLDGIADIKVRVLYHHAHNGSLEGFSLSRIPSITAPTLQELGVKLNVLLENIGKWDIEETVEFINKNGGSV